MLGRSAYTAAGLPITAISDEMAEAIDRWRDMYYNKAPWLNKNRLTLGLPSAISQQISMMVTLESKINIANGGKDEPTQDEDKLNERAKLIKEAFDEVKRELPIRVEYACALGGLVFKPIVYHDAITVDYVTADNFYPIAFNMRGEITDAIFVEKKVEKDKTFLRIERHERGKNGKYRITNKAYRSYNGTDFGSEIPLSEVEEWSDIDPEINLENIEEPLFAYFKIPQGNVINADSQLGVSVFARAETAGAIEEADKQFQRLMWEYEGGELAIDASIDAFKNVKGADGKMHAELPAGKERLYRMNGIDDKHATNGFFTTFNPSLRDSQYIMGLNEMLMRIEDMCSLSRGTLSDANSQVRTATELKIARQRTYATITSIQMSLEKALIALAKSIDELATLYNITPKGDYDITFIWDDSIIVDADTERARDLAEVDKGLMQNWEFRVKWYGETKEQAQEVLQEAAMQNIQNMMNIQSARTGADDAEDEEQPEEAEQSQNAANAPKTGDNLE